MNMHIILPLLLLCLLYMTFKSCKRATRRVLTVESLNGRLNYEIDQLQKRLDKLKKENK